MIAIMIRGLAFGLVIVSFAAMLAFGDIEGTSVYDRGIYVFLAAIAIGVIVRG